MIIVGWLRQGWVLFKEETELCRTKMRNCAQNTEYPPLWQIKFIAKNISKGSSNIFGPTAERNHENQLPLWQLTKQMMPTYLTWLALRVPPDFPLPTNVGLLTNVEFLQRVETFEWIVAWLHISLVLLNKFWPKIHKSLICNQRCDGGSIWHKTRRKKVTEKLPLFMAMRLFSSNNDLGLTFGYQWDSRCYAVDTRHSFRHQDW